MNQENELDEYVVFPSVRLNYEHVGINDSNEAAEAAACAYERANYLYVKAEEYAMIGLGITAHDPALKDHLNRIRPFKDLFGHPRRFRWTLQNVAQELRRYVARHQESEEKE